MSYESYEIAVGNNNAAGLVNIETITPSGSFYPFVAPKGTPLYSQGPRNIDGNGMLVFNGYATQTWELQAPVTEYHHQYLQDNYCGGFPSLSGLVTINSTYARTLYAHFNAVINLPDPSTLQYELGRFIKYPVLFIKMVPIA